MNLAATTLAAATHPQRVHGETSGLRPALQDRSRAAAERMVAAGRRLLDQRDFDLISIKDIAAEAGTSVGSFYHRFGTKERYFRYLIDQMILRREASALEQLASLEIPDLPAVIARGAIANHRLHAALLRSAIRSHLSGSDIWSPIRAMGQRILDAYRHRLASDLGRPLASDESERIAFAFVWLYGLLAQSVLNLNSISDYNIDPDVFETETVQNFVRQIGRAIG